MIQVKENNTGYIPFFNYLQNLPDNYSYNSYVDSPDLKSLTKEISSDQDKSSFFFNILFSFESESSNIREASRLNEIFGNHIKKILPVKEFNLFFFDQRKLNLVSIEKKVNPKVLEEVNKYHKEGVLQLVLEKKAPQIFPLLSEYNANGSKLNFIFYPIYDYGKHRGVLSILTPSNSETITAEEKRIIGILLNLYLNKIDILLLKSQLSNAYNDVQTYQAKLANDFRLSALGELTYGVVEDIISPLQVITSQIDFLKTKIEDEDEINRLKSQVKRIALVISRLVKFSNIGENEIKIQPCNMNDLVNEYFALMKTSLTTYNYEYVLDLEKDIPPILGHPNYIYQILANLIGLLKTHSADKVGIIVQSKFVNENVVLRFISTLCLRSNSESKKLGPSSNVNIKMIDNLMKKHEGSIKLESHEEEGTTITLTFPLKRKIRE
jgi:signal transduction histidine kinase